MKRAMTIVTAGVAALLLTLNMGVSAQQPDTHDRTIMTFSAPVELPGVTLQAGTYVFRIADTPSRNVIQVMTKDEMDIIGQWLFVPSERPDVSGETVVSFRETKEGTTPAVQYWYYPGEKIGKEFIYPKDQALKIAARTGATVKTEEGVINGSGVPPETTVAASEPAPSQSTESAVTPATETAVGTSGSSSDQAATPTDRSQESTQASNELPRTASPLPLSGLLGFFSLAGAGVIRRFRR